MKGAAPSGTANLVLAATLLVVLILRPRGLSRGNELPFPTEWKLPRVGGGMTSLPSESPR